MLKQKVNSYRDLVVWQRAMSLAKAVYRETSTLPDTERYGLVSQMRRAAVSIPSNIAEGSKRGSRKDYVQFLRIASGSTAELETQILLAQDIFAQEYEESCALIQEVRRMLAALISRLSVRASPVTSNL